MPIDHASCQPLGDRPAAALFAAGRGVAVADLETICLTSACSDQIRPGQTLMLLKERPRSVVNLRRTSLAHAGIGGPREVCPGYTGRKSATPRAKISSVRRGS